MKLESHTDRIRVVSESEADTDRLGSAISAAITPGTVIALVGTLGAGKTRLSRGIAEALGADPREIASPTFVLIHEYDARLPIYHVDAYRLRSPDEFDALGADEYLYGHGVCLIEWADRVSDRLPRSTWWVEAEALGACRIYTLRLDPAVHSKMLANLEASSFNSGANSSP